MRSASSGMTSDRLTPTMEMHEMAAMSFLRVCESKAENLAVYRPCFRDGGKAWRATAPDQLCVAYAGTA
jgi:hypothetical protein